MPEKPVRFGPDRIALLPVMVFLLGSLPVASSDARLSWLMLIPLLCGVWVLRARVLAAPLGVEVCNGLRPVRVAWEDVEGFDVPRRGPVRLRRRGQRPLLLTALPRRDLRRLIEVGERASGAAPAAT